MARTLSPEIQAAQDADDTETHDIMELSLPLKTGQTEPDKLHIGTGEVTVGTTIYHAHIRSMFTISFTRGLTPDGGTFTIANLDYSYGRLFLDAGRVLDGATVKIWRAFRRATPPGGTPAAWNINPICEGMLRTRPISATEVQAQFVPDMSNPLVVIGGDPLTQRCRKVFNENGNHPLGGPCGWQPSQGGDPLFCDHVWDSPQGCLGHGNQYRCGCVPPLDKVQAQVSGAASPTGGGINVDPYGGFGPNRSTRVPGIEFDPDFRHPFYMQ